MREPPKELDAVANAVIGAALEVHRILGPGFLESVYEEALSIEFGLKHVSFDRQRKVGMLYKGHEIGEARVDFLVEDSLVVELKAVDRVLPVHQAQLLSYLKTTGCRLGLLINFHESLLRDGVKRVVLSKPSIQF